MQGLPFFAPVLAAGAEFDIYAPVQDDGRSVDEAFDFFMRPPYFPIRVTDLPSRIQLARLPGGRFEIGSAEVLARRIPHIGATLGYRVEWGGVTVAYLPRPPAAARRLARDHPTVPSSWPTASTC